MGVGVGVNGGDTDTLGVGQGEIPFHDVPNLDGMLPILWQDGRRPPMVCGLLFCSFSYLSSFLFFLLCFLVTMSYIDIEIEVDIMSTYIYIYIMSTYIYILCLLIYVSTYILHRYRNRSRYIYI